jgi:hypothetical protein
MLAMASPAAAAPQDAATAEALFLQGRRAMEAGNYREACQQFAESERLDPGAGTLMNLAACEEKLGKLASAWEHWKESLDSLAVEDDRIAFARGRVGALEKQLPHLTVNLSPADPRARVLRDDVELRPASRGVALPIDPGDHVVTVVVPGRLTERFAVSLAEGHDISLDVHAGAPDPNADATGDRWRSGLGWAVGGLGAAGLVTAAVTGVLVVHDRSTVEADCPNKVCTSRAGVDAAASGRTLVVVNAAALGVGMIGIGVGAYLLLGGRHAAPSKPSLALSPGPGQVGVACTGTF